MKTIIITKTKHKKTKHETENTLISYAFKKISNETYIGDINKEEKEQVIQKLQEIIQENETTIIIALCKTCKENIKQIGQEIKLDQEEYMII